MVTIFLNNTTFDLIKVKWSNLLILNDIKPNNYLNLFTHLITNANANLIQIAYKLKMAIIIMGNRMID